MRKENILIGLLALLLLVASARGQVVIFPKCINSSYISQSGMINLSGTPISIDIPPGYCPYGCLNNSGQYGDDCNYSPSDYTQLNDSSNIAIVVGLVFIAFIFAYLAINESKNKTPEQAITKLEIFYMGLCILFVTAISLVLLKMAETVGRSDLAFVLSAIFTILVSFCFLFVILIIIWLLMYVAENMKKSYKKSY